MRWILLNLLGLTAFASTPIVHPTFDDGSGGWVTMGDNGTLRVTREAADKREGQPALALDYEVGSRKFGAAILPVKLGDLATMDQVHSRPAQSGSKSQSGRKSSGAQRSYL